jgi:hypothetical protein
MRLQTILQQHLANRGPNGLDPFARIPLTPRLLALVDSGTLTQSQAHSAWDESLRNQLRTDLKYRCAQSEARTQLKARIADRTARVKLAKENPDENCTIDIDANPIDDDMDVDDERAMNTMHHWKRAGLVMHSVTFSHRTDSKGHDKVDVIQPSVLPPHLTDLVTSGVITHEEALKTVHAELGRCELAVNGAEALAQTTLQAKLASRMAMASRAHHHVSASIKPASKKGRRHSRKHNRQVHPAPPQSTGAERQTHHQVHPVPAHPTGAHPVPAHARRTKDTRHKVHAPPRYNHKNPA